MQAPIFITVALPTPLRKEFDYRLPVDSSSQSQRSLIGCRVRVPFGGQQLIGLIISTPNSVDYDSAKIKAAMEILDSTPLVSEELLKLYRWAANYYLHPLGDVIATALPAALRQGEKALLQTHTLWQLTQTDPLAQDSALKRAPKQKALFEMLSKQTSWNKESLALLGVTPTQLKPLIEKGLLESQIITPSKQDHKTLLKQAPLELSEEQHQALENIDCNSFAVSLLFGSTGSGKTEIYLQALERILASAKQALILVPEIGLTPQTIARFQARFNRTLVVMHSNLNDAERKQAWLMAKTGIADIIIGTRSAVFTPMLNPGVIIIDEEHDTSFKQQDGFRYNARDIAAVRAQQLGIPLILGSATPSLESFHNAQQGRYQMLRLTQRPGTTVAPTTEIIDLRSQVIRHGMSEPLIEALQETVSRGEQALVFINRRGYSPTLLCHSCGWVAQCPRCDARLTVHQRPAHLHCHHCDFQRSHPRQCPTCASQELQCVGQGTEKSEQALTNLLPDTPIIRVDRDSTRNKNSFRDILDSVNSGEPCVLVGTQMLAKGHHFANVTLVAILDADSGLFSTDFRGLEKFGQLLLQVSGRAGRENKPGKVLIQTHLADHPLLSTLIHEGYVPFANAIQHERQLSQLPPFRHMCMLRSESKRADNAHELLRLARQFLNQQPHDHSQVSLLGPLPAPMEKRNERYRFQLQVITSTRQERHQLMSALIVYLESLALAKRVRWSIDVDPQDTN